MTASNNSKGFSLTELLVTMALIAIVLAIIFPQYVSILRTSTATQKIVKTEMDVGGSLEEMFKDMHAAGFGLPSSKYNLNSQVCIRDSKGAVVAQSGSVVIRSTASGDRKGSGKWAIVDSDTTNLKLKPGYEITSGSYVMVIDTVNNSLSTLGVFKVGSSGSTLQTVQKYAETEVIAGKMAVWIPTVDSGPISECYETSYYLSATASTKPKMCADTTAVLVRSKTPKDSPADTAAPVLDCVKTMAFRYGCIHGNEILWQSTSCLDTDTLRLMRIGLVVQSSPRDKDTVFPHSYISLFKDLGTDNEETVNFTEEERHYRWTTLEKTVYFPNVE